MSDTDRYGREDALVLFARLHERGLDPAAAGSGQ